jgi:UDP-hydrolysing UDP-N-acetyl-D-glucosamine 2-epimerase
MKTVGIVTGSRADYGIYRPIMEAIRSDREFQLEIAVTGMHLSPRFGTSEEIVADGFEITERVPIPLANDTPGDIGKAIGAGVSGFADLFARWCPDVLLIQGDRFEVFSAAVASLPFGIPLAHMHGGELTLGAIDDPLRHSITKIAHLHFVSTDSYARRVAQLGEEDWRITVTGAPGLDNLHNIDLIPGDLLSRDLGYPAGSSPLLVTLHPETRERQATQDLISTTLAVLETYTDPIIFTAPNADTYGNEILQAVEAFCGSRENASLFPNLGTLRYFSLMAVSCVMMGNSSSGIVEAASFELPVINVGARQQGRLAGANVVHVAAQEAEMRAALSRVLDPGFRRALRKMANPYGDGHAAGRVIEVLRNTQIDQRLLNKGFVDR